DGRGAVDRVVAVAAVDRRRLEVRRREVDVVVAAGGVEHHLDPAGGRQRRGDGRVRVEVRGARQAVGGAEVVREVARGVDAERDRLGRVVAGQRQDLARAVDLRLDRRVRGGREGERRDPGGDRQVGEPGGNRSD